MQWHVRLVELKNAESPDAADKQAAVLPNVAVDKLNRRRLQLFTKKVRCGCTLIMMMFVVMVMTAIMTA